MSNALKPVAAALLLGLSTQLFAAGCSGHVTVGEIDSGVADRDVRGTCLSALVDARPNVWGNHGQFVRHVAQLTRSHAVRHVLGHRERARLVSAAARSDVGKTLDVKIVTLGDFHGNLRPSGTRTIDGKSFDRGGAEYLAGVIKDKLAASPNTAFVSAGDLIGASPLLSALFHDEPTIEAMNEMGLMVNAVGNHEFDEGRDELLRMQVGNQHGGDGCHPTDGCQDGDAFEGARFQFLAANVVDEATGKTLFPAYKVMNFKGNKVAFIGMTLKGTPKIVTPSGVAGLRFEDEADTVNALVPKLRRQGVKSIVVVVHEGGFQTGSYNSCDGISGPIVDIVSRLDDQVDAVITGHTHQAYICQLPNRAGRDILVTSASPYGRFLTDIDLTIDTRRHDVVATRAENTELLFEHNVAPKDPAITALIAKYDALAAPLENRVIGHNADVLSRSVNAAGESLLGDVIADAQLHATAPAGYGDAVIAFMNPGGIRADFSYAQIGTEGDGNITYGEAFTVQPFGNSLVTLTLTGAQIETLLEQQFTGCGNNQPYDRVLQVSDGFAYTWNAAGPACDKVDPASITLNGTPVDPAASYRVTVNSFMADGGDNFAVLTEGTDRLGGAQDVDALEAWFEAYGVVDPASYPNATARIQRVN
ncbi:bifunctional metallophosphatase/5'-nucleotidase [Nitrogeniibacter mangrovi]|uniref:Bifunctional metallophosphatase/5'-nucleotidase n=1 Tax=Nitrogeniibacter mangrovi TaxID=2016596 RepID=A0A6C1AY44_9RHOO|nr:bifunctional metallophosphatase/5'-nucleotidase [Nitrogeniibacter mangrovi]QID16257.1 bifunctional metallophosphatase/5'-nucleotidase [Nitrogeniibacter mangrovi]